MSPRGSASAPSSNPPRARVPTSPSFRARLKQFYDLFEKASDIILINDREGWIIAANEAARAYAGYDADDLRRGVHLRDILPPDECEAALIVTQQALDGQGIPEVYEREAVLRDGRRRRLEVRSTVLKERNRPYGLETIARDITDKRDAEAFQASLLQVSQALLTAQRIDEVGRVVCAEAQRIIGVDGTYLWLRRGDELVGMAASGKGAKAFLGLRRGLKDSLIGDIYRAADVLVVNDFAHSLYANEAGTRFGVQAMLCVPLRRSGAAVGVLVFTDTRDAKRFTGTLRDRAVIFGAQMAVAVESAVAREQQQDEARVRAALLHVSRAIRESLEEGEVLKQIAHSAREVLPCDLAAVALWDEAKKVFRVRVTEGFAGEAAQEIGMFEFGTERLPMVRALVERRAIELPDPNLRLGLGRRWGVRSFLAIPMVRSQRLVGVVGVGFRDRQGPFSEHERRIVEGIAAHAAVAVENARLVEDLRTANQLKSEFLSTISHELRTPLSAIIGYADLLCDGAMGDVRDEQRAVLDRMLLNGRSLLDLINMTLDVNRLEASRGAIDLTEVSLVGLFDELQNEFSMIASDPSKLDWPRSMEEVLLHTDRQKLKVILRNLVDNALKFTPQGKVAVSAYTTDDPERVLVSVADTGIGIPLESQSVIFDMFRQVRDAVSGSRQGVGLGLYLVKRYADLLGGRVSLESEPGKGSTFTVELPLRVG